MIRRLERHGTAWTLTVMLASRNIILSFMCLRGVAVSPERAAEFCDGRGGLAAPLELVVLEGRWVRGLLLPWVHAFWGGGFLDK